MPYPGERASRLGHVSTVNNQSVAEALTRWEVSHARPTDGSAIKPLCKPLHDLPNAGVGKAVRFAITVDGSDTEVEATRENPTVKVGYLRVAGSFLDLDKLKSSSSDGPFVDSAKLRSSYKAASFDAALPGAGLVRPGLSGRDTWRIEVNRFLETTKFDQDSSATLADALLMLYGSPGSPSASAPVTVCPACRVNFAAASQPTVGLTEGKCPECLSPLYLGDVLRTHDEYTTEGSNVTALTRLMVVSERLMMLAYLDYFFTSSSNAADIFRRTIFITDGPLALFGTVAPLKTRLQAYIGSLSEWTASQGVIGPLIVGVEKSGRFWDHAQEIQELIPEGNVMMLTNEYINKVAGQPADHVYGTETFYGRRFIYRTSVGDALVLTVPPKSGVEPYRGDAAEDFASYPTLAPICEVLDAVRTRLYPDAVIPVALAHNAAALPLGVGQSVLRAMAQQGLGLPTTYQVKSRQPF